MRVGMAAFVMLFMSLTGCHEVTTADLVSIPDFVVDSASRSAPAGGAGAGVRAADTGFETRYQSIKAAAAGNTGNTRAAGAAAATAVAPASDSPHVLALLRTDVVQGVVDEVYTVRSVGTRAPAPLKLGHTKIREFRDALSKTRDTLLDDAATGKAGTKKLDRILLAYFKAYASGDFVDRNGTEIAKPSVNGGINNEAITGLATVFWEGLFDYWTDVPVFVEAKKQEVITVSYNGPDDGVVTPVYTRKHVDVYVTDDHRQPTALALGIATTQPLVANGTTGITELEAKAIRAGSNWAGKRANAWSAGVFGFLGKVNIGFGLIPGFSVGDDKTLMEVVKTSAEVGTRRGTQAALYKIFQESVRSPEADRAVQVLDQVP